MQNIFYDTLRFNSENEATTAGEIYNVEYNESEMKITDPDGNIKSIRLNFEPRLGLDVSDHAELIQYLNEDMEKRENNVKRQNT